MTEPNEEPQANDAELNKDAELSKVEPTEDHASEANPTDDQVDETATVNNGAKNKAKGGSRKPAPSERLPKSPEHIRMSAMAGWCIAFASIALIAIIFMIVALISVRGHNSTPDTQNKAEDLSAEMWYSVDVPDGWEMSASQQVADESTPLSKAQSAISYQTKDKKCYYNVGVSYREQMKLGNLLEPYSTSANALSNTYENLDMKKMVGSNVTLNTTSGKITAPMVSYTSKYDLDQDGKKDQVRESSIIFIDTDVANSQKANPVINVNYACVGDELGAADKVQEMLDHTTFYTKGEDASKKTYESADAK